MSSDKPLSILISGAGIAGSTLALCLTLHPSIPANTHITLIERSPVPRVSGQAIDIRGPAVNVIRKLGLEPKIKARHTSETGICWIDQDGNTIAQFDSTGDAEHQSGTSEYEILRGELAALLLDEIEKSGKESGKRVDVVHGEKIASLQEGDDGVVVNFAYDKLKSQKYDIVVAADGMASKTRKMMLPECEDASVVKPSGMYISFFTIPRREDDNDLWRWYTAPGGLSIHCRPHRNKKTMGVYMSYTNPKPEINPEMEEILEKGVEAQKEFFRKNMKDVGWQSERMLTEMDKAEDFYMQKWCMVQPPAWTTDRCAIMGDAAHAVMGVGTSLAMVGGYMIAGELAKMQSNSKQEIGAALKRYEDRFQPYAKKCQNVPQGMLQLANPQTKLGVTLMRSVLRFAYWTGLGKLMHFDGGSKDEWELPEYDFPDLEAKS